MSDSMTDDERRELSDDAEAWWYGLESEIRVCNNCKGFIDKYEAINHFQKQCVETEE